MFLSNVMKDREQLSFIPALAFSQRVLEIEGRTER